MDGMLFVTFFFPALVSFNIALSVVTYFLTLLASFGPEISQVVSALVNSSEWTSKYGGVVTRWLGLVNDQMDETHQAMSVFWPIFVSGVTIWTVLTTYGVGGAARYGKKGWRFVQPGAGGIRFILVQIFTWVTFALSVCMPWTTVGNVGWLTLLGAVRSKDEDPASHRHLTIVGSALGMLANTFVILGLMSFDPKEKLRPTPEMMHRHRRKFDTGKWKWNLFGDSEAWWWLFLILQGTFVVFSWQLAVMIEMSKSTKNAIVESLLLMVVTALLAVPVALTNAVAGKWKHGERNFRLTMPFQGGAIFVLLQGLGWALFAGSFVMTLVKLWSTANVSEGSRVSISSTASLGFISYLCIVASLFVFDPTKVRRRDEAEEEDDETASEGSSSERMATTPGGGSSGISRKHVHSIIGKRQSPSVRGALEYLVQWKPFSSPAWVLEELLMKEDPEAIKKNEKAVRTPRLGPEERALSNGGANRSSKARSISPQLKRRDVVEENSEDDEEEESDDEENDGADEESNNEDEDPTESDSDDVWEEVEDEEGNVFYYNEKRKLAQTSLPPKIAEALARQQHPGDAQTVDE